MKKIFQTLLETDLGQFLVHAEHDNSKVMSLKVYPISDGVVGEVSPFGMHELPDVVKKIEQVLP